MSDHWMTMKEQESQQTLTNDEIKAAIEHLAKALSLVVQINDAMGSGVIDVGLLAEQSEESWNELNRCRIYTEKILLIEEEIIPAMGEMYDAKSMFESLVAWKLGMTIQAAWSIRSCLVNAYRAIKQCMDEMISWLGGLEASLPEA